MWWLWLDSSSGGRGGRGGKKAKGALEIEFHSNDEMTRILDLLGVEEQ